VGVNIYKAGSDPPIPADGDCPPWLWDLAEPPLTLGLLQRKSVNELDVPLKETRLGLERRAGIKGRNETKAKKT